MTTQFKVARLLLGKTQLEVAGRAGLHVTVVSQIEHGWRIPTPDQIKKLEKALPNLQQIKNLPGQK